MKIRPEKPAPAPRRPRGFFLIELLGVLILMVAVSVLAAQLFMLGLQVMRQTKDRETLISRVDSALDSLRRDAWAAGAATPTDNTVEFRHPAGAVTWHMNGTTLTRTDAAGTHSWIGLPAFHFSPGPGGTLSLEVDSGPAGTAKREHVSLISPRTAGATL